MSEYFDVKIHGVAKVIGVLGKKFLMVMTERQDVLHYSVDSFIDCFRDRNNIRILEPAINIGETFEVMKVKAGFYKADKIREGYTVVDRSGFSQVVSDQTFYRNFRVVLVDEPEPVRLEMLEKSSINNNIEIWVYSIVGGKIIWEKIHFSISDMVFRALKGNRVFLEFEIGDAFPTLSNLLGRFTEKIAKDAVKVLAYDIIDKRTGRGYLMNIDGSAKKLNR